MSEESRPTIAEIEEFLLLNAGRQLVGQMGVGRHGIVGEVIDKYPGESRPNPQEVAEAIWGLVGRGLLYLDFSNDSDPLRANPKNWSIYPTKMGWQYDPDGLPNPDIPDRYLQRFAGSIPDASDLVRQYVNEALQAYTNRLYMAAAVMLGVAAEAAFLEMAEAFCACLPEKEAGKLRGFVESPKSKYSALLDEFRKRFEVRKGDFTPAIGEKIDLQLNTILELIRTYRNDSGHPTGVRMERDECHQSLVAFTTTAKRLYSLKREFEQKTTS